MSLDTLSHCPICGNPELSSFLTTKDFTVTGEEFSLQRCASCSFVLTNPRPAEEDLGKYYASDAYISHQNEASGLMDSIYLVARRFTLRWKTNLLERYTQHTTLLDYGCGTGAFLRACADKGWNCTGVEPTDIAHDRAKLDERIEVVKDIRELTNKKFDVITLWHVLEHVADLQKKVGELRDRLTEGGMLFVAVPNHESFDALTYNENWAAYDVPRHLWHFSKTTMEKLMSSHKLKVTEVLPMKLDAFYVSMLSEKYKRQGQSFSGLISGAVTGLRSNIKAKQGTNYSSLIYVIRK